jgi:hypothetical protein
MAYTYSGESAIPTMVRERRRPFPVGNGDQPAGGRLVETFDIERDVGHDARGHGFDTGDGGNALLQPGRRPPDVGEDVGEPGRLVERGPRALQRFEIRDIGDEHRHPGRHDRADGDRLSLHLPEIAEELPVENGDTGGEAHRSDGTP